MATADLPKEPLRELARLTLNAAVKLEALQPLADTRENTRLGRAATDLRSAASMVEKVLAAIRVAELEAQIAALDAEKTTEEAKV